jgi:hypothetical protein
MPGYELGRRRIELNQVFGCGRYRIMAREELDCEKKNPSVI